MDDKSVLSRIGELADEELALEESHVGRPMSAEDERRLRTIEVELDQCWDLLRQRRARRAAGQDPDQAEVRPEDMVERYLQ